MIVRPLCECGCGEHVKRQASRYRQGHSARRQYAHVADRLWGNVDVVDGCWLWQGGFDEASGYARLRVGRQRDGVHRIAWELATGQAVPNGLEICHSCDRPLCINPAHLFPGTALQNAEDKVSKGRQCYGTKNAAARLTEAQVKEIRHRPRHRGTLKPTAYEFGVSTSTIKQIRAGVIWRHLETGAA